MFESETATGASNVFRHYIEVRGKRIAVVRRQSSTDTVQYLLRDHQDSIVEVTSSSGALVQSLAYDAWGLRRDPTNWAPLAAPFAGTPSMKRGYTDHEHLDNVELINMNGRVQDPKLGVFISADPIVQSPHNSQSLNRYSYVLNNPLTLVDPSGFSAKLHISMEEVDQWMRSFDMAMQQALAQAAAVHAITGGAYAGGGTSATQPEQGSPPVVTEPEPDPTGPAPTAPPEGTPCDVCGPPPGTPAGPLPGTPAGPPPPTASPLPGSSPTVPPSARHFLGQQDDDTTTPPAGPLQPVLIQLTTLSYMHIATQHLFFPFQKTSRYAEQWRSVTGINVLTALTATTSVGKMQSNGNWKFTSDLGVVIGTNQVGTNTTFNTLIVRPTGPQPGVGVVVTEVAPPLVRTDFSSR